MGKEQKLAKVHVPESAHFKLKTKNKQKEQK
jgi:hypothetical protein